METIPFAKISKLFDPEFRKVPAVSDENGKVYTYGDLYQSAYGLHLKLKSVVRKENQDILLYLNPDADFIVGLYAIIMAGHTPFLVTMDLKKELGELGSYYSAILTRNNHIDHLSQFISIDEYDVIEFEKENISDHPYEIFEVNILDAFINSHSSGSTGTPKLIPGTYQKYLKSCCGKTISDLWRKEDIVFSLAPLNHAYGLLVGLFIPFYYGAMVRVKNNGFSFQDICNQEVLKNVTLLVSTPPVFKYLTEFMTTVPNDMFKDCRYFLSAAAKLDDSIIFQLRDYFNLHIFEIYGSTEALIIGTRDTSESLEWRFEEGLEWKVDEKGGLHLKINLYPGKIEGTWYETGDLVSIEDEKSGVFSLAGRADNFIKIKGLKIYTHEIENSLKEMPQVEDVVVVKHPEEEEAVAFIVPVKSTVGVDAEKEIRSYCSRNLAGSRIPKYLKMMSEIPRNKTGKVVLSELKKLI